MRQGGFIQRHRVAIASYAATLLAVGVVAGYAISADGYESHKTRLNDGGIWVTGNADGVFGRFNKPVDQVDGFWFTEPDQDLDVVQQGAAVVGIDRTSAQLIAFDPTTVRAAEGGEGALPAGADILMAGGTLATLVPNSGELRAVRVDTAAGKPLVSSVAEGAEPIKVGKGAAMTITSAGEVVAVSADNDQVTRLTPATGAMTGFAKPSKAEAGFDVGALTTMTSVGKRLVFLNGETGQLNVLGGGAATLDESAVLQQPGPSADTVLVSSGGELLEVDLDTGDMTGVAEGFSGDATQPVRLGACVFGAWSGGQGEVVGACGSDEPQRESIADDASDLVFRVNRGEILLNDRASGAVWNIDDIVLRRLDNWDALRADDSKDEDKDDNTKNREGEEQPPRAIPDEMGARPGRLSVLHPLDNDTAGEGRILAIRGINAKTGPGEISIGPDRQTVQILLPAGATGTTNFTYVIDDGRKDMVAQATVSVAARGRGSNEDPELRTGYKPRQWTVPASGTIDVPVLGDWRDPADSDLVTLAGATAVGGERSGAMARTTGDGRIRFTAPAEGGSVTVKYDVSDGFGRPVQSELTFAVQSPTATDSIPAVAEPDIVAGEVGQPIVIRPLGNDLPGADPLAPDAVLELAGKVAAKGGLEVKTDLAEGTITVRSRVAKTFFLSYAAAFGSAKNSEGQIRVDVVEPKGDVPPVAMPDQATVFGTAPTMVDVLANDVDLRGAVLVTTSASAETENQLDLAVIQGRWISIRPRQAVMEPQVQVVRYRMTNGTSRPVEGEVTVIQRDAVADNTPVTTNDRAKVRAGSGISVAALDNDFSLSGEQLSLVSDAGGKSAGELRVTGGGKDAERGFAYVSGRLVRYVAPVATEPQSFQIHYVATNSEGLTAPGTITVDVVPTKARNQQPQPPTLEGRVVSGDTVKLRLPGADVDPDGDGVTMTGIASAPKFGRIVRIGANSIEYRAFPDQGGTDEFGYSVIDANGAIAEGVARVAVVPAGIPQPPLAVNDTVVAAPDRQVRADVMANDLIASGDYATVELIEPVPDGVELDGPLGPILVDAPADGGKNIQVRYRLTNGIDESPATLTVRTVKGHNNPPVAFDAFGSSRDGDAVSVDVLKTAYDPDGAKADLSVEVFGPTESAPTVEGAEVTVTRREFPQVVPFRIVDADGGAATASIFVPAKAHNAPYLREGAQITLDPGTRRTVPLEDLIVDPAGGRVRLTRTGAVSAAPGSLAARATNRTSLEVIAAKQPGPGVAIVEVVSSKEPAKGEQQAEATLSIPVQVGKTRPILNCPQEPIRIDAGDTLDVQIAARCHVWLADEAAGQVPAFEANWRSQAEGLSIASQDGSQVSVQAAPDARDGAEGVLAVRADGSAPGLIRFVVRGRDDAPQPTLTTATIDDMEPGESRTLDLAQYFTPGVTDPEPTILETTQRTRLDADISSSGTEVTIRMGQGANGRAEFLVRMSDVPRAQTRPRRQAQGLIVVNVLGAPEAPSAPVASVGKVSQTATVSWRAAVANGSPVSGYEVQPSGMRVRPCRTTSCEIDGLQNGQAYRFRVRALSAAGTSPWSGWSNSVRPDARPGQVGALQQRKADDGVIVLSWSRPKDDTSVDGYLVRWDGREKSVTDPGVLLNGLNNNRRYKVRVYARNSVGLGPVREGTFQSQGPTKPPAPPAVLPEDAGGEQATLRIRWDAVPPNGEGDIYYRVLHNERPVGHCTDILGTECVITNVVYDGSDHSFRIGAYVPGYELPRYGTPATWKAVTSPAPFDPSWSVSPTGVDNQAVLRFSVPNLHASGGTISVLVDGVERLSRDALATNGREVITVPDNAGPHAVALRACNDHGLCNQTSAPKNVQTFGPLQERHFIAVNSAVIDGNKIQWTINIDSNGDPAQLRVRRENGTVEGPFVATTPGQQVFTTSAVEIGFSATEDIVVYLEDPSTGRGPVQMGRTSVLTAKPPAPTIAISKGTACKDGTTNPCSFYPNGCTEDSCAKIRVVWSNFPSGVRCSLHDQAGYQMGFDVDAGSGNADSGAYYATVGGQIYARCDFGRDAAGDPVVATSNTLTWPG